jgi:hypothetical protein
MICALLTGLLSNGAPAISWLKKIFILFDTGIGSFEIPEDLVLVNFVLSMIAILFNYLV